MRAARLGAVHEAIAGVHEAVAQVVVVAVPHAFVEQPHTMQRLGPVCGVASAHVVHALSEAGVSVFKVSPHDSSERSRDRVGGVPALRRGNARILERRYEQRHPTRFQGDILIDLADDRELRLADPTIERGRRASAIGPQQFEREGTRKARQHLERPVTALVVDDDHFHRATVVLGQH